MSPNQARLIRFCLNYPGWQTIGPDSRRCAIGLADWGILERSETSPDQFRIALADDCRRMMESANVGDGINAGSYRLEPHPDGESVRVICDDGRGYALPLREIECEIMDALDRL